MNYEKVQIGPLYIDPMWLQSRIIHEDSDCESSTVCSEEYRSLDGSCNNLQHPAWGSSMRGLGRLAASVYSDADLGLRLSEDGSPLPSARLVSQRLTRVAGDSERGDLKGHMMQWGQLLTNDE